MSDHIVFIRSSIIHSYHSPDQKKMLTRYWNRSTQSWVSSPSEARGYKTPSSASAAVKRIMKEGHVMLPTGEVLDSWGWTRRDKI